MEHENIRYRIFVISWKKYLNKVPDVVSLWTGYVYDHAWFAMHIVRYWERPGAVEGGTICAICDHISDSEIIFWTMYSNTNLLSRYMFSLCQLLNIQSQGLKKSVLKIAHWRVKISFFSLQFCDIFGMASYFCWVIKKLIQGSPHLNPSLSIPQSALIISEEIP